MNNLKYCPLFQNRISQLGKASFILSCSFLLILFSIIISVFRFFNWCIFLGKVSISLKLKIRVSKDLQSLNPSGICLSLLRVNVKIFNFFRFEIDSSTSSIELLAKSNCSNFLSLYTGFGIPEKLLLFSCKFFKSFKFPKDSGNTSRWLNDKYKILKCNLYFL